MNGISRVPKLHSLRAKILLAVIVCAVLPLAAVGIWLSASAARSGELLLRSQLDTVADRQVAMVRERWSYRRSDVLLLAGNEPLRRALSVATPDADPPPFLQRAFATTNDISGVIVRGADGRVIWTLGNVPVRRLAGDPVRGGGGASDGTFGPQDLAITIPVANDDSSSPRGTVVAFVRLDGLLPSVRAPDNGGTQFIVVHDRAGGGWFHPATLATPLIESQRFEWDGHQWLAVRRSVDDPSIDIYAVGQLDPFVRPFAHTAVVGATALMAVALIVIVVMLIVASRLTASVTRLSAAADAVSAGNFDAHIDTGSTDEVGRVARAFNAMTESIRQTMRERSQREAVAAMGELAATLAHQVRSPATAIRIDVQRAHDKLPADAPSRPLLARALGQLDRLERAVAGSLKVARSGGAAFTELDVREPLRRAIAGVQGEQHAESSRIDASGITDEPIMIRADAPSLEQLFGNVLTNAMQAVEATANGRVRVTMPDSTNGRVEIAISDEGSGMTAAVLERAGEPLFSTKPEGTGLGLAIAKRIAAAHGGSLRFESDERTGTTVVIELRTG